jgi:hypothetical protein
MPKLTPRYTKYELEILLMCIMPWEDVPKRERDHWDGEGFRHFRAPNITPIEHFMPKPPPRQYSPAPLPKPAA